MPTTIGHWYPVDHSGGVFQLHYSVNVLGWMEDPFIKSKLQYNEVFRSNNIQLMNLCYQLGKCLSYLATLIYSVTSCTILY